MWTRTGALFTFTHINGAVFMWEQGKFVSATTPMINTRSYVKMTRVPATPLVQFV